MSRLRGRVEMTRSASKRALEQVVAGSEAAARLTGADVDAARVPALAARSRLALLRVARGTFEGVEGVHAPGERLSVPSTLRFYRLLGAAGRLSR